MKLLITLPKELHARLKAHAKKTGMSMAEVVRRALRGSF